jgi:hypothetical protein
MNKWEGIRVVDLVYWKHKMAFTAAQLRQHFDRYKNILLHFDSRAIAIAGILNIFNSFGTLLPVNFYPHKCSPAGRNYVTYDGMLLAIVEPIKHQCHSLEGVRHKI